MRIFWTFYLVYFFVGNVNGISMRTQNSVEVDSEADADKMSKIFKTLQKGLKNADKVVDVLNTVADVGNAVGGVSDAWSNVMPQYGPAPQSVQGQLPI